jgi:hypothetical protein
LYTFSDRWEAVKVKKSNLRSFFLLIGGVLLLLFLVDKAGVAGFVLGLVVLGVWAVYDLRITFGRPASPTSRLGTQLPHVTPQGVAIASMSGVEFENFMAAFLEKEGYFVKRTPISGDQGIDLILERPDQPGRKKTIAVQLKRTQSSVGNQVVSHTYGGRAFYGADEAWLITTSYFTPKAREMALRTEVRLIDGAELADWLKRSKQTASSPEPEKLSNSQRARRAFGKQKPSKS